MRVQHVLQSRPLYYDRNPLSQAPNYGATIAPAGTTVRATYTVPTARKAFLQAASARTRRNTAAAPVGVWLGQVVYHPAAGGDVILALAQSVTNGVNDMVFSNIGAVGLVIAGDAVNMITADASTGGDVQYYISAHLVEFDA